MRGLEIWSSVNLCQDFLTRSGPEVGILIPELGRKKDMRKQSRTALNSMLEFDRPSNFKMIFDATQVFALAKSSVLELTGKVLFIIALLSQILQSESALFCGTSLTKRCFSMCLLRQ